MFPSVTLRCMSSFSPTGWSIPLGKNYFILPSSFPDLWAVEADTPPCPPWRKQLLASPASVGALLTRGATGPWKQGGLWFNQEAHLEKPGSLIHPYLVPVFTACYCKGRGYQGAAGAKPLEIHKELSGKTFGRSGDWGPDVGSLGKIHNF